jgi:hypothetical protein
VSRWLNVAGSPVRLDAGGALWWPGSVDAEWPTVVASGTPHAVGAWSEAIASLSAAADVVYIEPVATSQNVTDSGTLLDVGVGGSGSETVVVSNVPVGWTRSDQGIGVRWAVPVPTIASGSRVAIRCRSAQSSKSFTCVVDTGRNGLDVAGVDTIGANTAASRGASIPSRDTWTQVGSTTAVDYQAVLLCPTLGGTNAVLTEEVQFTLGVGPSSGSVTTLTSKWCRTTSNEVIGFGGLNPTAIEMVPSGSKLWVKTDAGATRSYHDAILLGVR